MDEKIQVGLKYLRRFPESLSLEELVELKEKIDKALKDKEYSIEYDTTQDDLAFERAAGDAERQRRGDVYRYEHYVKNQTIQEVAQTFCKRLSSNPVKLLWVKVWDKNNCKWELIDDINRLPEPKRTYWARLEKVYVTA